MLIVGSCDLHVRGLIKKFVNWCAKIIIDIAMKFDIHTDRQNIHLVLYIQCPLKSVIINNFIIKKIVLPWHHITLKLYTKYSVYIKAEHSPWKALPAIFLFHLRYPYNPYCMTQTSLQYYAVDVSPVLMYILHRRVFQSQ